MRVPRPPSGLDGGTPPPSALDGGTPCQDWMGVSLPPHPIRTGGRRSSRASTCYAAGFLPCSFSLFDSGCPKQLQQTTPHPAELRSEKTGDFTRRGNQFIWTKNVANLKHMRLFVAIFYVIINTYVQKEETLTPFESVRRLE